VAHISSPGLLVLHGLRVKGMANVEAVAQRFALNPDLVHEMLLDYEAVGWISRVSFADINGWALTAAGRAESERTPVGRAGPDRGTLRGGRCT
jgi:hypothetical protein